MGVQKEPLYMSKRGGHAILTLHSLSHQKSDYCQFSVLLG